MPAIEQYIYTRLSAADSPHKTTGFQSAFLPAGLKGKLQAVSLEAHIHFPEVVGFVDKRVVFWLDIAHETWQVILFVQSLPEVRDEFGRGGVYLAHAFLIPPSLWVKYRNPLRLSHLLEDYRFKGLDAMLSSPLVDRKAGTIAAIDPGVYPADDEEPITPPHHARDRMALALVYRMALGQAQDSSLVFKGTPRQAEAFFTKMLSFLPAALKGRLGWDSAFDGGKLFFSPFRLVAYAGLPPVMGYQALLNPHQDKLIFADEAQAELVQPFDPYSRWLAACDDGRYAAGEMEVAYAQSQALTLRLPFPPGAASPCFAKVNVGAIREWISEATDPMLSKPWRKAFAEHLPDSALIRLAVAGFSDEALAAATASTILAGHLTPQKFPVAPYASLLGCREPRLRVLATMWTKGEVDKEVLYDIVTEDRELILRCLASHGWTVEAAQRLGFTATELAYARPYFKGGLSRLIRRWLGK
jgi:hypothetical protein